MEASFKPIDKVEVVDKDVYIKMKESEAKEIVRLREGIEGFYSVKNYCFEDGINVLNDIAKELRDLLRP